jgi:hypothetical protein
MYARDSGRAVFQNGLGKLIRRLKGWVADMYVIMKEPKKDPYLVWPTVHELAKTRQVAIDRCRTLNKAAKTNSYYFERVKPILDASGTKADPSQISF